MQIILSLGWAAIAGISAHAQAPAPGPVALTATLGRQTLVAPNQRSTLALTPYQPAGLSIPVAFLDADNTLRVAPSGAAFARSADDVALLPCIAPRLKQLADDGYFIAIVSNQGEIATGEMKIDVADGALQTTARLIKAQGGVVHYYDFAEGNDSDPARKPGIGMAQRLLGRLQQSFRNAQIRIDPVRSFMVGDSAFKRAKAATLARAGRPGRPAEPADLRPDGTPGVNFGDGDRLFAENLVTTKFFSGSRQLWSPKIFFEPDEFFGWRKAAGSDAVFNQILGDDQVFTTVKEVEEFEKAFPQACCVIAPNLAGCPPTVRKR